MNKDGLLLKDIREKLSDLRYGHSLKVAESAVRLAEKYGGDAKKAYTAGIGHDVFKEIKREDALKFLSDEKIELSELEMNAPKLWHAILGAAYLKKKYGFSDDIISAVRYHTTGRANMSLLEKILFTADFISPDRDYKGVDGMRKKAEISLELAMAEGLRFTINELSGKCMPICPDTLSAYNETLLYLEKAGKVYE